jgi:O-6-methylguanine DNA methyltransferase
VRKRNIHLGNLAIELGEYFAGTRKSFTVPVVMTGTVFQKQVWNELLNIPFGETRSYMEQASAIGKPGAIRAVARANGSNPVSVIIPCHRVIGSDGKLTGYGGGLWRKRWLLEHERKYSSHGSSGLLF